MVSCQRSITPQYMFENFLKNRTAAQARDSASWSLDRQIELSCASNRYEDAIDLSVMRMEHLERRHPESHESVIMATANAMRIAVIAGQSSPFTKDQVARVENAADNRRAKNSPETVFYNTVLVEYFGAFTPQNEREKEFGALRRLSAIADTVPLDPILKKLSCSVRLESCFNFCHSRGDRRTVIDDIFKQAATHLATDSPSLSLYYQGFMKWKVGRYTEAQEVMTKALERVDGDIAAKRDSELTKTSLLEGQIRVSLSLGNLVDAEKQAFGLINRVRSLHQAEEVIDRCKNILAEIYTRTGDHSLAELARATIGATPLQ